MARAKVVGYGDDGTTCGNCGADLSADGAVATFYSIGITSRLVDEDVDEADYDELQALASDAEPYRSVCKSCDEIVWQDEAIIAWRL